MSVFTSSGNIAQKSAIGKYDQQGLSLLEIVIAVAVIAIFTVLGFLAFQNFTDNARQTAVEQAANDVFTVALAEDNMPDGKSLQDVAEEYNTSTSDEIRVEIEKDTATRDVTVTAYGWESRGNPYIAVRSTNSDRDDGNSVPEGESGEEIIDINDYKDGVFSFETSKSSSQLLIYGVSDNATIDHSSYDAPRPLSNGYTTLEQSGIYTVRGGFLTLGGKHTVEELANAQKIIEDSGEDINQIIRQLPEGFIEDLTTFHEYIAAGSSPFADPEGAIIHEWKNTGTQHLNGSFAGSNITTMPEPPSTVKSMYMTFSQAEIHVNMTNWDVSNVEYMRSLFHEAESFNQDISSWDVSNVIDMSSMFQGATEFNNGGQLLGWGNKTSNVESMKSMFYDAINFNQDISDWDVSNVTDMSHMLKGARSFNNGDLPGVSNTPLHWGEDMSNTKNMKQMFNYATSFNQDISNWDVSNVIDMSSMFAYAESFNQDLSSWVTSNVTSMAVMFRSASSFNQDISDWDVSNVRDMSSMFSHAENFNNGNQPLDWQDTSSVIDMDHMFSNARSFNQDVSSWNVPRINTKPVSFDLTTHPDFYNNPSKQPSAWY